MTNENQELNRLEILINGTENIEINEEIVTQIAQQFNTIFESDLINSDTNYFNLLSNFIKSSLINFINESHFQEKSKGLIWIIISLLDNTFLSSVTELYKTDYIQNYKKCSVINNNKNKLLELTQQIYLKLNLNNGIIINDYYEKYKIYLKNNNESDSNNEEKDNNAYNDNLNATYESNLQTLGVVDYSSPTKISLYASSFDGKEELSDLITKYNKTQEKNDKKANVISYNDFIVTMLSSVTSVVNIISYVLIAFVSVSLIVSSIMIGIITYISVLERTKEIGILRSIGASKRDISRVFNAETFIIGLISGCLGILITLILNIPISHIVENMTGVGNISKLPFNGAIALICIDLVLTVLAGLIPSKIASKKDPVEALRSE